ncbi:LuxR C-terminal-related transcriptional regulator [Amycolatopsis suaedae]|uniref:Response regulator transcription factor n=1 Tax=Amycolatopsis suaedae TaxID=2510978 RepID=A0A4Q7IZY4_9PSEU|nr:response regulator transcription factor [Amycolatopsis suaedae]RZQ60640.1 response regulator transcription factor [Amycolatopsis suaedae]
MNPVRVFFVDDQELLAEALAVRLSAAGGVLVVGRAPTTDPGLGDAVSRTRPHVVAVDPSPLGPGAADLLETVTAAMPGCRLVVLTGSSDPVLAATAARAGAMAWVGKDSSAEHLVGVLRGVVAGKAFFAPDLLGFVLGELRNDLTRGRDSGGPLEILSARERDVLLGIVEGKRGSQIAADLFLSVNTVRTHTHNIFSKLKVHSRLEAASLARSAGMRPRDSVGDGSMAT